MQANNRAYVIMFEYLMAKHSALNPATPLDIVNETGLSRATVYRLLAKRINGQSDDETVSDGIFLAGETFGEFGKRPAKTYYADPTRITKPVSAQQLNESLAASISIKAPKTFIVQPKHLTPAIVDGLKADREYLLNAMDRHLTVGQVMGATLTKSRLGTKEVSEWGLLCAKYDEVHKNYEATLEGKETFNTDAYEELKEGLASFRNYFMHNAMLLEMLMQDSKYGTPSALVGDYPMPDVGIPIVKEVR